MVKQSNVATIGKLTKFLLTLIANSPSVARGLYQRGSCSDCGGLPFLLCE
jgi:hypothetical protein